VKDTHDVITHAKFGDDRLKGSGVGAGQISAFPIDFAGRPYNTLTLPCECVIKYSASKLATKLLLKVNGKFSQDNFLNCYSNWRNCRRTIENYATFPIRIFVWTGWHLVCTLQLHNGDCFVMRPLHCGGRVSRWLTRKSHNRLNCTVVQYNFRYTQFTGKGQLERSISPKAWGFRPQFLWQKCKSNGEQSKYAVCSGGGGSSDLETKVALLELKHIMAKSNLV